MGNLKWNGYSNHATFNFMYWYKDLMIDNIKDNEYSEPSKVSILMEVHSYIGMLEGEAMELEGFAYEAMMESIETININEVVEKLTKTI